MSAAELLVACRRAGIVLKVAGGSLSVDAPAGALTPELRGALAREKPALLAALAPTEYVTLKGGLTLPAPALQLAWSLEDRGFRLSLDANQQVIIEPLSELTEADRAAIKHWRLHLGAIVAYQAPEVV